MFISPIWDNESQRIGMRKCTPIGYVLLGVSDLIGFVALLFLVAVSIYLIYRTLAGTFNIALLWFLTAPFGLVLVRMMIYRYSWLLAAKKQFYYNYETRSASWFEGGKQQIYKWQKK